MRKLRSRRVGSVLGDQRIEYLEERIHDCLTHRVGALGKFGLVVACSKRKISALLGYGGGRTLDCRLCEVGAIFDRSGLNRLSLFSLFRCGR